MTTINFTQCAAIKPNGQRCSRHGTAHTTGGLTVIRCRWHAPTIWIPLTARPTQ